MKKIIMIFLMDFLTVNFTQTTVRLSVLTFEMMEYSLFYSGTYVALFCIVHVTYFIIFVLMTISNSVHTAWSTVVTPPFKSK